MKNRKKNSGILAKVCVFVAGFLAVIFGGYFMLDKLIVPKYFKDFGINGMSDLMNVVMSLYNSPKEAKLIKNGYTQHDLTNAIAKLQNANYKIENDGTIKEENFDIFKGEGKLELTDREVASVCNEFLGNGLLEDSLSHLNYLNITQISLLDLIISIDEASLDDELQTYSKADVDFILKVNTENLRVQIAEQMRTPIYLLKMIIPDIIYFEVNYTIDLENEENRTSGSIAINGRSANKSEDLINILIGFIFNEEDDMDLNKFTQEIGNVAMQGIDALGSFRFAKIGRQAGIVVNEAIENPPEEP